MPDTMIERVARAMTATLRHHGVEMHPDDIRGLVFVTLEALGEPTPKMIDRFVSRALCVSGHGDGGWSNYAREQWSAMLSAAIEGE